MEDSSGGAGAEDGRKWISGAEAAALLRLGKRYFSTLAKERGYTRRLRGKGRATLYLRKEIESWADFRQLRRQWIKKYPGFGGEKRYTEKIDLELARRLFITTKAAATLLGVALSTVKHMVANGRLVSYQSIPGRGGSQLWFSRRAVIQIAEDPERLKRREIYFKGMQGKGGGEGLKTDMARMVRGGVPKGWLTTKETMERLGVNKARVRDMRLTGRLRGEQIWRRGKPLKYWYYPDYEVERVLSLREEVKRLSALPLLAVPGPNPPTPFPDAFAALTGKGEEIPPSPPVANVASGGGEKEAPFVPKAGSPFRLDADGPEPKWACDDVNLTRAFYLLGKSEY